MTLGEFPSYFNYALDGSRILAASRTCGVYKLRDPAIIFIPIHQLKQRHSIGTATMKSFYLLTGLSLVLLLMTTMTGQATPVDSPVRAGVVVVLNGSGDYMTLSDNLEQIFCARKIPLAVYTLRWSRWSLGGKDHQDYEGQVMAAARLANYVGNYRATFPREKIYLIGHSTGNHVLLAATPLLPPQSVERIVLLAPTVSYRYNIRSALLSSRCGVDSLYSKGDQIVMLARENYGTADRRDELCAGEIGFAVPPPAHPDACHYKNLRQCCWNPTMEWTGHHGGHGGFIQACYLDAYVRPLLLP
jgi:pimeloyl-ACP methyl ester carboxylesterase